MAGGSRPLNWDETYASICRTARSCVGSEAETGKHVWAERYDRDLAEKFFQRPSIWIRSLREDTQGLPLPSTEGALCFKPAISRTREARQKHWRGARSRSMVAMRRPPLAGSQAFL